MAKPKNPIALRWPVHADYEVQEKRAGLDDRVLHRLVPVGRQRSEWIPAGSEISEEIANLAEADDTAIHEWVRQNGLLGLDPSGETVEAIREQAQLLANCRRLLQALREGSSATKLRELAVTAAGHLVNAEFLAAASGVKTTWDERRRPEVGAEIQALHALGVALTAPLSRFTWVLPRVRSTRRDMRLERHVVGQGPLGVAFLQTMEEALGVVVNQREGVTRLDWRSIPRPCARCGTEFRPRQESHMWCSDRCRWASAKARERSEPPHKEPRP